jgi:hypothetical protein
VLKEVKGFTRTVGGSVAGPSSVRVRVRGGVTNREFGGGLVITGGGCIVGGEGEGQTRPSGEMHGTLGLVRRVIGLHGIGSRVLGV